MGGGFFVWDCDWQMIISGKETRSRKSLNKFPDLVVIVLKEDARQTQESASVQGKKGLTILAQAVINYAYASSH